MVRNLSVNSKVLDPGMFRYGQPFYASHLRFLVNRLAIAWNLIYGRYESALSPMLDIVDEDGNIDEEKMNDLEYTVGEEVYSYDEWEQDLFVAARAHGSKAAYGSAAIVHFVTEEGDSVFRWISAEDNLRFWYDANLRLEKIQFKLGIEGYTNKTVTIPDPEAGTTLDDVLLLINETSRVGQGRSYLEPIFDTLISIMNVSQSASAFSIRAGPGIPTVKAPMSLLKDPTQKASIDKNLKRVGINSKFLFPKMDGLEADRNLEFELVTADSSVDFGALHRMFYIECATYTELPVEYFEGSERGLRASENDKTYVDRFREGDQSELKPTIAWMQNRRRGWDLSVKHLSFRPDKEQSEMEQEELKQIRIDNMDKLVRMRNQMGFDQQEILDYVGIEELQVHDDKIVEVDPMDMENGPPFGNDGDQDDEEDEDNT